MSSIGFDTAKTLEDLENSVWGEPEYYSSLVVNCHRLRKVPLDQLTAGNLRLLIGQQIGLDFLIPLAVEIVGKDPLAEGDYYEGDLLHSILSIDKEFWQNNIKLWQRIEEIVSSLESRQEWISKTVLANVERFRHESFAAGTGESPRFSYQNRIFSSVSNSGTGEVSAETIFRYHQQDDCVWAEYSGGEIVFGNLIAKVLEDNSLEMRYQHLNKKGELMTGKCLSIPEITEHGKIRLHEKWQWTSGDFSSGESVIEE